MMTSPTINQKLTLEKLNAAIKKAEELQQLQEEARKLMVELLFTLRYHRELALLGISQEDVMSMLCDRGVYFGVVTKDEKGHRFRTPLLK